MEALLADRSLAARLGEAARAIALERFSIERFARDWTAAFAEVTGRPGNVHPIALGTRQRRLTTGAEAGAIR